MWPVSDEEIRNLGESRALVASISPSGGTWKLNSKSRCSKSYIELKKNTLRDQCHQTIVSSQSCFAVLTAQSSEKLPSSFGAAKGRRFLVGAEHISLKKWALSRRLIFWRPSILMLPGIFLTYLTRTFLTRPRALMTTGTVSVLTPHLFEISLYFNSFSTILTHCVECPVTFGNLTGSSRIRATIWSLKYGGIIILKRLCEFLVSDCELLVTKSRWVPPES